MGGPEKRDEKSLEKKKRRMTLFYDEVVIQTICTCSYRATMDGYLFVSFFILMIALLHDYTKTHVRILILLGRALEKGTQKLVTNDGPYWSIASTRDDKDRAIASHAPVTNCKWRLH